MKRIAIGACILLASLLTGCSAAKKPPVIAPTPPTVSSSEAPADAAISFAPSPALSPSASISSPAASQSTEENSMHKIQITVGNKSFSATLEQNEAANSFLQLVQQAPLVLQMQDYAGFEKIGSLKASLSQSDRSITTQSGDIVLYNGTQIVVFYGSNTWSYTRLGRIDDLSGWEEALGSGAVTLTFGLDAAI